MKIHYNDKFDGIQLTFDLSRIFRGVPLKDVLENAILKGSHRIELLKNMNEKTKATKRSSKWKNSVREALISRPLKSESGKPELYEQRQRKYVESLLNN